MWSATPAARSRIRVAGLLVASLALAGCGGSSSGEGGEVSLSFLVDNQPTTVAIAEGLAADYHKQHPNVTIEVETRPQGGDGDNVVKTRLATGEMADVFLYNTGSLFQALNPEETLVPVDEAVVGRLEDSFTQTVTAGDQVYGAPIGFAMGGGVLYNKAVYDELKLDIPKTWDEFMANNAKIKAAGTAAPVAQTYQETWTAQLFLLGDYHNVQEAEPGFAQDYTAGDTGFSTSEVADDGFEHLQEVHAAGYLNKDFASSNYNDGIRMIAKGEAAHYPMLTDAIMEVAASYPKDLDDLGFFALPGEDADSAGLTVWTSAGLYIPTTTEDEELEAAEDFRAFVASKAGCASQARATTPGGPFMVDGCELPNDVPGAVKDLESYFEQEGATTPALEFLSPIKGPALEHICVEVGSGIRSAQDGAALYDEDVEKQAQQLGLEGW
ncbi:MAG: ABC transporter substrate-binding protein [Nocardioidaceae bacterium]